jgi:anti-sigma regulatory factor (Ser/Thr protein kinase)
VFCAILQPATARVSYSCAGHPPAILLDADGGHQLLEQARGVPLAVHGQTARPEAVARLAPGATLLLYTDGLVERRGESLDTGIERAVGALRDGRHRSVEELAKDLGASLLAEGHDDDVAFLIYRQPSMGTFHYALPARPSALAGLRQALRGWLDAQDVPAWVGEDLLVVISEAATNAMEHGYRLDERQVVDIEAVRTPDRVELTVRDSGRARSGAPAREPDRQRGRGLLIMRALTDELDVDITSEGTEVRMIRRTDP